MGSHKPCVTALGSCSLAQLPFDHPPKECPEQGWSRAAELQGNQCHPRPWGAQCPRAGPKGTLQMPPGAAAVFGPWQPLQGPAAPAGAAQSSSPAPGSSGKVTALPHSPRAAPHPELGLSDTRAPSPGVTEHGCIPCVLGFQQRMVGFGKHLTGLNINELFLRHYEV